MSKIDLMPRAEYNSLWIPKGCAKGGKGLASEIVEVPIAGKIIDIKVSVGMQVKEGDVICLLESMKMENPILAPVSGTIKEIQVSPAQVVKAGNTIAIIES
jgi:biotin carboxyl carrier protein